MVLRFRISMELDSMNPKSIAKLTDLIIKVISVPQFLSPGISFRAARCPSEPPTKPFGAEVQPQGF